MSHSRMKHALAAFLALILTVPSGVTGFASPLLPEKPTLNIQEMPSLSVSELIREQDDQMLDAALSAENSNDSASPSAPLRLILSVPELTKDYGAEKVIKYEGLDTYLLSFNSEASRNTAYETITQELGAGSCTLDSIVTRDAELAYGYDEAPYFDDDNQLVASWATVHMGMDLLRDQVVTDNIVTVAVIDTGMDVQNPFFAGRLIAEDCYNFGNGKSGLKNMYDDPEDGHGTHVAGSITDATPSNVKILPIRMDFDKSPVSDFIAAIDYAISHGADVINCSFEAGAGDVYGKGALDDVLKKAKDKGIIVVASSGNSGSDGIQGLAYPASSPLTIAVGATNLTDGNHANLSSFGKEVDFAAPGEEILSAKAGATDESLARRSGTSMSTPAVAAAFAYLCMFYPEDTWQNSYDRMKNLCDDRDDPGKDIYSGWGVPILGNLRKSLHVHDFTILPREAAAGHTHYKVCKACGKQFERTCSNYRVIDSSGAMECLCGKKVASHVNGNTLIIDIQDKDFVSWRGLNKAVEAAADQYVIPIITHAQIQEGYTYVPFMAFDGFPWYHWITFPNSIDSLHYGSLTNEGNVEYLDLSKTSITRINDSAFEKVGVWSSSPTRILLPATLKEIGEGAFLQTEHLQEIDLSKSKVDLLNALTFRSCLDLVQVKLPSGLSRMDYANFAGCQNLKEINLEDTKLEWIRFQSFRECKSLEHVVLPATLKTIEHGGFSFCDSLEDVYYLGDLPQYITDPVYVQDGGELYQNDTITVHYPKNNGTWKTVANHPADYQYGGKVTYQPYDPDTCMAVMHASTARESYDYTGKAIKPKVTVKNRKGQTLTQDTDFTVTYANNTKPGTAKVILKGQGTYTGEKTLHFIIYPESTKRIGMNTALELDSTYGVYNKKEHKPLQAVRDVRGNALVEGKDYMVEYNYNIDAGTCYIYVQAPNDINNSVTLAYEILPAKLTKMTVIDSTYTYDDKSHKPKISIKAGDHYACKKVDASVADIDITLKAAKVPGRYKITAKGHNNYTGTISGYFNIKVPAAQIASITPASKAFTVKWKALNKLTGYEIMYGTSKSKVSGNNAKIKTVKGTATSSAKITGLSAKKNYYVKLRSYVTIKNKTYYSDWSTIEKTKTK